MSGISLCVRWRFPSVPSFLASAGIGIGFCVLGLSLYPQPVLMTVSVVVNAALIAGMIDYWLSAPELDEAVEGATLRITFHGDERHPTALYLKNIAGWFAYHSPYARIDGLAEDGTHRVTPVIAYGDAGFASSAKGAAAAPCERPGRAPKKLALT